MAHVAYNSAGHVIDDFHKVEKNSDLEWRVLVSWHGLERIEDSWEPIEVLLEDVPAQLKKWLRKKIGSSNINSMCGELELTLPKPSKGDTDIQIHPFPTTAEPTKYKVRKKRKTKLYGEVLCIYTSPDRYGFVCRN